MHYKEANTSHRKKKKFRRTKSNLLLNILNVIPFILSFRLKTFHLGLFSPFYHTSNLSIYADGSDSDPIITSTATALVHAITNL